MGKRFYFSTWIRTKDQGPVRRIILFFSQSHKLNVIMQTNNCMFYLWFPFLLHISVILRNVGWYLCSLNGKERERRSLTEKTTHK